MTLTAAEDRTAELETERDFLRRALRHSMRHLILLREGKWMPDAEAQAYVALLNEATEVMDWTQEDE